MNDDDRDSRPNPDPTVLTTEQLRRELTSLRELLETRMDADESAAVLRLDALGHIPIQIDQRIGHLRDLEEERFRGIALQFAERDVRTDQAAKTSADALAAALQAAKELVGTQGEAAGLAAVKSETSFTKQLDQVVTIISTLEKALDARINEMKERLDRGEGTSAGAAVQRFDTRAGTSVAIAGFVAFLSVIAVFLSLYSLTRK